jgi:Na+-transporting methylmalonyl-CoA/oxaloacetate decarboxylase beta subunit
VAAKTTPAGPITQTATLGLTLVILVFGIVQLVRGDAWGVLYGALAVMLATQSVRALLGARSERLRRSTYREATEADADA